MEGMEGMEYGDNGRGTVAFVEDKKPDIRELVGVAVNTSVLTLKEDQERALDRVAALGAAALTVSTGADLENVTIGGSRHVVYGEQLDARDVLAGELGPILWHIRYGGQHGLVPRAIPLYARWLQGRRIFAAFTEEAHVLVLERFSGRVLHEWLSDRCVACGGSGKMERTKQGSWIRPRGSMQRNATFRVCVACNGTRRASVSHTERVKWLGIERSKYESERWSRLFEAALTWLSQRHAKRITRPLTIQLERRKRRF